MGINVKNTEQALPKKDSDSTTHPGIRKEFTMRVLSKDEETVTLGFTEAEREMLIAVLDASKVTDPTITDAKQEDCEYYRDLFKNSDRDNDEYILEIDQYEFLKIRRLINSVTIMGERDEYSDFVNRLQSDETIDELDARVHEIYSEAFPSLKI